VGAANGLGSFSFLSPPLLNGTRFSGGIFSEGRAAFWVRSRALVEGSGSGAKQSGGIDVLSQMKSSRLFLGVFAMFRIQGVCKSACTLFLGIRNMCIERDATLMFHGGHDIQEDITGPDTRASRAMLSRYNEALRRYLLEGHYMDSDEYHTLMGSELIDRFGYRECPRGP
jgi:hypothetical protein